MRSSGKLHIPKPSDNPISSMTRSFKLLIPLLILLGLVWIATMPVFFRPGKPPLSERQDDSLLRTKPALSALAPPPDWPALDVYQSTIIRSDFEQLLATVFTTGNAWQQFININDAEARIQTGNTPGEETFHLHFAPPGEEKSAPRHWRTASELPPTSPEKPLADMKIALDPGHIGGEWAKMEERWFVIGDGTPVCEGDMTLSVAQLLKPMLENLGATVSLVRDKPEPVTRVRPDDLLTLAREAGGAEPPPEMIRKAAEQLFYRTAEIRARAEFVNQSLKPDLVICLHFDANAWGDPNNPTLVDSTHLHLLLNGSYNDDEVPLADQRFALLQKLLQRTHQEEAMVGAAVADTFAEASGLPPYQYPPGSTNARPVDGNPYLWARNLLANRLYDCPVIYMEPYVMNSTIDYPRIQAGDYEGLREVSGKMQPSIFREYAGAVAQGLRNHYRSARAMTEALPAPVDR